MSVSIETREVLVVTVTPENQASRSYELDSGKGVFIGSAIQCGVQILGESISPIHCRLSFDGEIIQLHDWMSGSGTFVNGQRIDSIAEVGLEDLIQIGDHVIRFSKTSNHSMSQISQQSPLDEQLRTKPRDGGAPLIPDSELLVCEPVETPALEEEAPCLISQSSDVWNALEFSHSVGNRESTVVPDTVELLMAEVGDLRTTLGQPAGLLDSDQFPEYFRRDDEGKDSFVERLELRLQQLLKEAELSDQRIRKLEDLLLAAESAHRAQEEEKQYLESWLDDIEQKFSLKEQEQHAELEILRKSHETVKAEVVQLQQRLINAASGQDASTQFHQTMTQLQQTNQELQEQLDQARRKCRDLELQLGDSTSHESQELREERAKLAHERAELARQRHDLVNQLSVVSDEVNENQAETEMACRIRALREHLREIHEQEKQEKAERSLTSRISNLWHRVSK